MAESGFPELNRASLGVGGTGGGQAWDGGRREFSGNCMKLKK